MKILTIALKDLTSSFRSFFAAGMMFVAPLLLIGLLNFAFGGLAGASPAMPAVSVGLVNADQLPPGAPLDESLGDSIHGMFYDESVASWITASDYSDEASARLALDKQAIDVAVIVPQEFTQNLLAGDSGSHVLILSDPTLVVAPQVVQNMIVSMLDGVAGVGIAIQTVVERQQASGLQLEASQITALIESYTSWYKELQRDLFHNPDQAVLVTVSLGAEESAENPMQNILGTMMAGQLVFFAFFTGANSMISILREDEEGTLARMFTTPISRTSILAGKFLAVLLIVAIQGLVMLTATHYTFGMNWGDPLMVGLALFGQVIAATGLGVLLVSFIKTTRQGGPVMGGGLTALGMLGGLFTAGIAMPKGFSMLSNLAPQGWVMKGWNIVLNGQTTSELLIPSGITIAMGLVMFLIGSKMFQKRFA